MTNNDDFGIPIELRPGWELVESKFLRLLVETVDELNAQLAEAQKDTARLEFLFEHDAATYRNVDGSWSCHYRGKNCQGTFVAGPDMDDPRDALDAARKGD